MLVQNIKKGNYDVVAANHTLILGWNSQGISLLRQIATNKLERPNGAYDGCSPPCLPKHRTLPWSLEQE